jgi:hypothetical protein
VKDAHAHTELIVLYQQAVADIERAKQWQWKLLYSTVLAQFGIVALTLVRGRPQ